MKMIKALITFLFLILLVSCNSDGGPDEIRNEIIGAPGEVDQESTVVTIPPVTEVEETVVEEAEEIEEVTEEFSLVASRSYSPNEITDFNMTALSDATFLVPRVVDVKEGNAGVGWMSLTVGERKFCFRGNASNSLINDGDSFVLHSEKEHVDQQCRSREGRIAYDQFLEVNRGDEVVMSILGGGCSTSAATCKTTIVELNFLNHLIQKSPLLEQKVITAKRVYFPHSCEDGKESIGRSGTILIPREINALGNSGRGWLSLVVGDRKFCYRGNASSRDLLDGDKFILTHEILNVKTKCNSRYYRAPYDRIVQVNNGETFKVHVIGGGCKKSLNTCVTTAVSMNINDFFIETDLL